MRDLDIRHALVEQLRLHHEIGPDNRIWSELALVLGASRVDLCLVNGALTGYEIKSPRDNFDRLDSQIYHYNLVLDYAHIVVSSRDLLRAKSRTPSWWGIIEASETDSGIVLKTRRPGRQNRHIDALSVAQLLWRDEAEDELRLKGVAVPRAKATRWELWDALVAHLTLDDLKDAVRSRLKLRPQRQADLPYVPSGAMSLQPAT